MQAKSRLRCVLREWGLVRGCRGPQDLVPTIPIFVGWLYISPWEIRDSWRRKIDRPQACFSASSGLHVHRYRAALRRKKTIPITGKRMRGFIKEKMPEGGGGAGQFLSNSKSLWLRKQQKEKEGFPGVRGATSWERKS